MNLRSNRGVGGQTLLWCLAAAAVSAMGAPAFAQDQAPTQQGRQPLITNQFNAATGGAIGARRPGLMVQQGIAVQQGTGDFFTDPPERQPGFFRDIVEQIIMRIIEGFQTMIDGLNLATNLPTAGGQANGQPAFTPIANPATSGQGTSVPIQ